MVLEPMLVISNVMHKRIRPIEHGFKYKVYYLCFALSRLTKLKNAILSLDRWNLFSFYKKDYGSRDGSDLDVWVRSILETYHFSEANGEIVLMTLPRILGYSFNPVSFWYCFDNDGLLRAVLSEVSNTFGEHHCYLSFHDDHRVINENDWLRADKVFHVSPFFNVQGYYLFRFVCRADKMAAYINYFDDKGLLLVTSVNGVVVPLTMVSALKAFVMYPLVTFKVIFLIHIEALRLLVKGLRYFHKPVPPTTKVSR